MLIEFVQYISKLLKQLSEATSGEETELIARILSIICDNGKKYGRVYKNSLAKEKILIFNLVKKIFFFFIFTIR